MRCTSMRDWPRARPDERAAALARAERRIILHDQRRGLPRACGRRPGSSRIDHSAQRQQGGADQAGSAKPLSIAFLPTSGPAGVPQGMSTKSTTTAGSKSTSCRDSLSAGRRPGLPHSGPEFSRAVIFDRVRRTVNWACGLPLIGRNGLLRRRLTPRGRLAHSHLQHLSSSAKGYGSHPGHLLL